MLLLLSLTLSSGGALPVLTDSSFHPFGLTAYGVKQSRTCVRISGVVFGYSGVVIEKVREVLSIRTVKF